MNEQDNNNIDFFILVFILASIYTYANNKKQDKPILKFTFKNQPISINLAEKSDEKIYLSEGEESSEDEDLYENKIVSESPVVKILSPADAYRQAFEELDQVNEVEFIKQDSDTQKGVANLLNNLHAEEDTLEDSGSNSEKTPNREDISVSHPFSSKAIFYDDTQFDNSTIKTIVSGDDQPDVQTQKSKSDPALSTVDSTGQQKPVQFLIKQFETINSSTSSIKTGENSFVNKNILNKAKTRSNETLKGAMIPVESYEDCIEVVEDAVAKEPLDPELKTPVKARKASDAFSVCSKGSTNSVNTSKFFTPLIERNNGRGFSSVSDNGSNFLKFNKGNDNINFGDITTSSAAKSVVTQDICATATIVLPEVSTSTPQRG